MTPHDHRQFVPGCFRCDLGRDEAQACVDAMPGDWVDGVRVTYATSDAVRLADGRNFHQDELRFIAGHEGGAKFAAIALSRIETQQEGSDA